MNYSGIKYSDMINGPGIRVSLFVSGCSHACPGCFNKETWNPKYGETFTEKQKEEIFDYFRKYPMLLRGLSDRKSTRLNSSHANISYAVFCLKKTERSPSSATRPRGRARAAGRGA